MERGSTSEHSRAPASSKSFICFTRFELSEIIPTLRRGGARAMMKLRIATGLGLVLFMATMIGGPVRVSNAQDDQGGVTLASLAGKFSARGSGFFTLCFNAGFTALVDCASAPPHVLPFNNIVNSAHHA